MRTAPRSFRAGDACCMSTVGARTKLSLGAGIQLNGSMWTVTPGLIESSQSPSSKQPAHPSHSSLTGLSLQLWPLAFKQLLQGARFATRNTNTQTWLSGRHAGSQGSGAEQDHGGMSLHLTEISRDALIFATNRFALHISRTARLFQHGWEQSDPPIQGRDTYKDRFLAICHGTI